MTPMMDIHTVAAGGGSICGFNATPAIVTAATLYVLRCVCPSDLPLCEGVLRCIDLQIPQGLLNPPAHPDPRMCAAVVAGNVETSQGIVDVFLKPLTVSLLTNRRTTRPYGIDGGGDGQPGRNVLVRSSVETELPPCVTVEVVASDRLIIKTPGGGGCGKCSG